MAKAWEGERNIGNKGTPSTIIFITKVAKLHFIFLLTSAAWCFVQ